MVGRQARLTGPRRQAKRSALDPRPRSGAVVLAIALITSPAAPAASRQLPPPPSGPLGLDVLMPRPEGSPPSPAATILGRGLFFDPILSRDSSLACASCHDPTRTFTDGRPLSIGVFGRRGSRNVPAIINRGYGRSFFWDGRIATLEEQVLQPIQAAQEMDMSVDHVLERLRNAPWYVRQFATATGRGPDQDGLALALAAYVRTIRSGDSRFDQRVAGETTVLTPLELRGLRLFQDRAGCTHCHFGPNFTDEAFHNTGVAWRRGTLSDSGRYLVTRRDEHLGAFKTPTLRDVARTAPYMHDGSLATLDEVVRFYADGGHPNPHLDPNIRPLRLDAVERAALVAFLGTLTGTVREGVR